jgi:hypothetical protein
MVRAIICSLCNTAEGHIRDLHHLKGLARYMFGKDGAKQLDLFGKH